MIGFFWKDSNNVNIYFWLSIEKGLRGKSVE